MEGRAGRAWPFIYTLHTLVPKALNPGGLGAVSSVDEYRNLFIGYNSATPVHIIGFNVV